MNLPTAIESGLDALASPLDRVRSELLARAPGPFTRALRSRARRISAIACCSVIAAFLLMIATPAYALLLSPLVLGVPHLLADVRFLVLRRGLHREAAFWVAVALPLVAAQYTGNHTLSLLSIAGASITATGAAPRRIAGAIAGTALCAVATRHRGLAEFSLLHAHNLVAVLWLLRWRKGTARATAAALALVALFSAVTLSGLTDPLFVRAAASSGHEASVWALAFRYAPAGHPELAARAAMFFGFSQGVHYAIWLRLIPEVERPIEGAYSFRQSLRKLRADVPLLVLGLFAGLFVLFAAWGAHTPLPARDAYLTLATFHGYLELALLARSLCDRRAP